MFVRYVAASIFGFYMFVLRINRYYQRTLNTNINCNFANFNKEQILSKNNKQKTLSAVLPFLISYLISSGT